MYPESKRILDKLSGFMAYQCEYSNMRFISVSEGCKRLTGYLPEQLLSRGFAMLVHADDAASVDSCHEATLSVGAPSEIGFRIKTPDGSEKYVLSRSRVAKTDENGMPHIIEGILTDITREIQAKATTAANRENSDFLSKMGYEVRTPMNAILGLSEMSLREDLPENVREYTQVIKKSGRKLMAALNNIIDLRELESGRLKIITETYDTYSLIYDTISTVKEQLGGLEFYVYADSKLPNMLTGDVIRVRQILQILLSNAVKFTEKGHISLSIKGTVSNGRVMLTITVSDTGRGIREGDIRNLFKEYAQFDSKTVEGAGLGLSVAKKLAELMGGTIDVASGYRIGSVFTLRLPQGVPDAANPLCEVNHPERKNVIILESNPISASSAGDTMKNAGVRYIVVSNREEFLAAVENENFSHVFANEKTHGKFLCREFKEINPAAYSAMEIVLLSDDGRCNYDAVSLARPLYCLPVSDIFNNSAQSGGKRIRFTAPDARVLVVDDISANFTVASGFLSPYALQVDYSESGTAAIEAVKLKQYDLILMDHLMPEMKGTEATRIIRSIEGGSTDCKNVPIVALTANDDYESREIFRESGANGFLLKPINEAKLHAIIENRIPKHKQQITPDEVFEAPPPPLAYGLSIRGIDVLKGINRTGGNFDTYLRVLKNFSENGRRFSAELRTDAETGDTEQYHVKIHAVAGLAKTIGADELSETAAHLEEAAKRGDTSYILEHNVNFLSKLGILLGNLKKAVEQTEASKTETSKTNAIEIESTEKNKKSEEVSPENVKKILIIDDTDSYLFILSEILADDYETLASLGGEDGLETARLTNPDLIFLDIVMPGIGGYEVLAELKADENLKHIPVILMSANENELRADCDVAGFLKKPFEAKMVRKQVNLITGGCKNA
ncbi:MAG: response regulator [Defluviitaleaceae bacterium]|nr:response regulator [Defluviitaleaceae bacterium]